MAKKRRKKTKTAKRKTRKYHRKNPKRVAAGRRAAAARWGKKTGRKKTKRRNMGSIERAIKRVLRSNAGLRNYISKKKTVKRRKRRASKAVMFGPVYSPKARTHQRRLDALAKARAAKKAYARYREAGIL